MVNAFPQQSSRWLCWDVHTAEPGKVHFSHLRFHTNEENRMWLPTAEASSNPLRGEKFEFLNVKRLFQTNFVLSVILQKVSKLRPWAALRAVSIQLLWVQCSFICFHCCSEQVLVFPWFQLTARASGGNADLNHGLDNHQKNPTATCSSPSAWGTACSECSLGLLLCNKHPSGTAPELGLMEGCAAGLLGKLIFFPPSSRFCSLAWRCLRGLPVSNRDLPSPFLWVPGYHTC